MAAEELHVIKGKQNLPEEMQKLAGKLTSIGRKPYIIPGGGSNKIGDLGYLT